MNGKLPTKMSFKNFDLEIRHRSFLNEELLDYLMLYQMVLTQWQLWEAVTMALSAFYKDHLHLEDEKNLK